MTVPTIVAQSMGRIPPSMQHAVLRRGAWSLCTMEHSRIGAVHIEDPGAPFHHIGLPLGRLPARMGIDADDRRSVTGGSRDCVSMIEAGVAGTSWWNEPLEAACLYFMPAALTAALGEDGNDRQHALRTTASLHSPVVSRLVHALFVDATSSQPHGLLVGDAIFVTLAAALGNGSWQGRAVPGSKDWRVRRGLEYIHAHLVEDLNILAIASAAGTSPFHLSRQFAAVLGLPIWQYVLRERARYALALMGDREQSLLQVSIAAGFATYASFIAAIRAEFGCPPSVLRAA